MKGLILIMNCPHCRSVDSLDEVIQGKFESTSAEAAGYIYEWTKFALVSRCKQCKELSLCTFTYGDSIDPSEVVYTVLYPQERDFSAVPEEVRVQYEKAQSFKVRDSEFYAIGLRRTLEALCTEKNIPNGKRVSLYSRLKTLAINESLPQVFVDMAEYLRHLGNAGAHANGVGVNPSDVVAATEFTDAILEYLYVAPAKLDRVKTELAQRVAQAEGTEN